MKIGKIIARTAWKTALCILLLLILTFALTALVWPMTLGDLGAKWNISVLATTFTARGYDYSGDINDLGLTVERAVQFRDDHKIERYGSLLIGLEDFSAFADFKDGQLHTGIPSDYRTYVYGNISKAQYRQGKVEEAIATAKAGVELTGYLRNSALSYLVAEMAEDPDPDLMTREEIQKALAEYFKAFKEAFEANPAQENRTAYLNVCLDYYVFYRAIGDQYGMTEMEKLYNELSAQA